MAAAAPILWDVVEELLDEAAFLAERWEAALASPLYTLAEVASGFEARLLAQLDGLMTAGEPARERLLEPALVPDDPGRALAAALALLESPGRAGFDSVVERLGGWKPAERGPLVRALGLAHRPGVERELVELAAAGAGPLAGAALEALAFRGVPVAEELLVPLLTGGPPESLPGALRASRLAGPRLQALVEHHYLAPDPAARDAALAAGLWLGLRSAWLASQRLAEARDPGAGFALLVLGLSGDPSDAERIAGALEVEALRPAALLALGRTGRAAAAEACLPFLGHARWAGLAGEAFSAITGLAIEGAFLRAAEEREEPLPLAEDLETELATGPEAELRLPDPDAVAAWWKGARARFDGAKRYLGGGPYGPEALLGAFLDGPTRRRQVLGLELAIRSRGEYAVETLGWAADQLRSQAGKKLVARAEVAQPFGQLLRNLRRREGPVLQVENRTPFAASMFVFPDASGIDTLYVVVKATFAITARGLTVAGAQQPVVPADEYWGEPGTSSLRHAGEAHLPKPATDVVLVGSAHAPGGRPAPYFGLSVSVGQLKKVVHVFGDRTWRSGTGGVVPSAPAPAASVPLRWERAYGGQQELGAGTLLCEPRNPVGCGFCGKRSHREMEGTPVPNLEHPDHPIRSVGTRPPPAGVGFVAPSWQPRVAFAGTYDEAWQRRRAPYLPADFDPRFLQAAPPDQVYPGFLQGGEPVELINASPAGVQRFALPACDLEAKVEIAGEVEQPPLRLETLLLEPDQGRLSLLWRGAVPCDKRALQISEVALQVKRLQGVAT